MDSTHNGPVTQNMFPFDDMDDMETCLYTFQLFNKHLNFFIKHSLIAAISVFVYNLAPTGIIYCLNIFMVRRIKPNVYVTQMYVE